MPLARNFWGRRLTKHKMPHGVVVRQRPRELALGKELHTRYCKRVHVDLLRQLAVPAHELW